MDSVKLREILVEVARGGAKVLADPEVFECAVEGGIEELNALAASRVAVRALVWRYEEKYRTHRAETPIGKWFVKVSSTGEYEAYGPDGYLSDHKTEADAKAACQDDIEQRWRSMAAAHPVNVVTDEMAKAFQKAFQAQLQVRHKARFPKGQVGNWEMSAEEAGLRAMLTVSPVASRTEADVSPFEPCRQFVRDVAKLSLSGEVTDEDEGTIFDPWHQDQHECLEKLIRRARDLKDGGAS